MLIVVTVSISEIQRSINCFAIISMPPLKLCQRSTPNYRCQHLLEPLPGYSSLCWAFHLCCNSLCLSNHLGQEKQGHGGMDSQFHHFHHHHLSVAYCLSYYIRHDSQELNTNRVQFSYAVNKVQFLLSSYSISEKQATPHFNTCIPTPSVQHRISSETFFLTTSNLNCKLKSSVISKFQLSKH